MPVSFNVDTTAAAFQTISPGADGKKFEFQAPAAIMVKKPERHAMDTANIAGRVLDMAALVDYQAGSVVSRTVVDKPAGTLTLFAFDAGQGLSEHTAPFDALVYILDGEAEITLSGRPLPTRAGEMVIMPANEPHALRAERRFKMLLVMIKS
jgi:quercetin dioxygenase-like cupin family protein